MSARIKEKIAGMGLIAATLIISGYLMAILYQSFQVYSLGG